MGLVGSWGKTMPQPALRSEDSGEISRCIYHGINSEPAGTLVGVLLAELKTSLQGLHLKQYHSLGHCVSPADGAAVQFFSPRRQNNWEWRRGV